MLIAALAAESAEVARIQVAGWSYVTFAITVTLVKIVAIIIGYMVAKLGYTTMMAGVQGKDSLELGAFGAKLKFRGVTPGLALGVAGILMIGWALSAKSHFSAEASEFASRVEQQATNASNVGAKDSTTQPEKAKKFE